MNKTNLKKYKNKKEIYCLHIYVQKKILKRRILKIKVKNFQNKKEMDPKYEK